MDRFDRRILQSNPLDGNDPYVDCSMYHRIIELSCVQIQERKTDHQEAGKCQVVEFPSDHFFGIYYYPDHFRNPGERKY